MAKHSRFRRARRRGGRSNKIQSSVNDVMTTVGSCRIGLVTQSAGGVVQGNFFGAGSTSNTAFRISIATLTGADAGLGDLGQIYQQWRIKAFKLVYRTAAGTQNGSFVIAVSEDPTEAANFGAFANIATNLDMFRCKRHISVWKDGYLSWRPSNVAKWYFTSGGDQNVSDADVRQSSQVEIFFSTDGGGVAAADANMGSIIMEYVIQFRLRRPTYTTISAPVPSVDGSSSSFEAVEDVEEDISPQVVLSRSEYTALVALGKRS